MFTPSHLSTPSGFSYVLDEPTTILFVDDDPILREFADVNLSSDMAKLVTVGDGLEALEQLSVQHFDLVLADLEMPRMDGFELLARIRAEPRWRHLPVIVETGREDVAAIDRAFHMGATSFVVKPLNWRLLSYQMKFVLRTARAEMSAGHTREAAAA